MSSRIVRTYGPAGISRSGVTGASAIRSARPTVNPVNSDLPELRLKSVSPVEVRISRLAREAMRNELFHLTRVDDLECGGFLFAPVARSWNRTVEINHATTTGENAIRRNASLSMDTSVWEDTEDWIKRNGWHDVALAGIWHSHPNEKGRDAGLPSDSDLAAFLNARDLVHRLRGVAYSVGLIFTTGRTGAYRSEHSWATPDLHCWVTRRTPAGTPVTERADVLGWR
jgi:proteasome lid subunit RPN8/RPN11